MLSQKAIEAKISNLEVKLDGLYQQIDPVCTVFKSSERAGAKSKNSFASNKGRGRPPKEGVEKLIKLQNKLKNQTKKTEEELEKITQGISKQVKDLNAEIELKKMNAGKKTLSKTSKIKQPKKRRLREHRAVNYNEQNDHSQYSALIIRTRNSRGRFISTRSNGSGVSSRLRTKNSDVPAKQEVIKTRSSMNLQKPVFK